MIGGLCGAVVGLVVFGGILFVPAILMGVGMAIGAWVATDEGQALAPSAPPRAGRARAPASPGASAGRVEPGRVRVPAAARSDLPRIDVNAAGVEELSGLPGVGRAAAARIVEHRDRYGGFASLRELEHVEGFDMARVARLSPRATLSPSAPSADDVEESFPLAAPAAETIPA